MDGCSTDRMNDFFHISKNGLIAAILNLILVGLGYLYLGNLRKAVISFIEYVVAYFVIFYIATFIPHTIWLGLIVTAYFVYDGYKDGEKQCTSGWRKL